MFVNKGRNSTCTTLVGNSLPTFLKLKTPKQKSQIKIKLSNYVCDQFVLFDSNLLTLCQPRGKKLDCANKIYISIFHCNFPVIFGWGSTVFQEGVADLNYTLHFTIFKLYSSIFPIPCAQMIFGWRVFLMFEGCRWKAGKG